MSRQIIDEAFVKPSGTAGWCFEALHKQALSQVQPGLWVFQFYRVAADMVEEPFIPWTGALYDGDLLDKMELFHI